MKLLRNLTWQKLWRSYVKTNKGVEQQALINNLQANANRVQVPINPPAAQPVQDKGVQVATNHEPLYLRFKRMKPKEFNGSTDPLVAQGWLKSIELVLNFMGILYPRI
ncbi:hypothetical protein TIFTF001_045885 [Ficus carica]|uniref:Uncharacterized protein n=1 Tax=Ficus carica TaxID=3494 RepID=A0AA87YWM5_FICCA|nr:hypothetical protein TIFTF001_045885 [Ficus carica]